ncbi:phage tail protein [Pyxidicoccus caerfyrddinensis]|uniref:phage tail protein n=1 Tax=Pyxidicoccus caerfyrddinensis TaxID=2709663 RepID=UPI0013D8E9A8|nr:phage tail protein [Pyxidicoccus caerfyrddinensis]
MIPFPPPSGSAPTVVPTAVVSPVGSVLPYAGPINACTQANLMAQGWLFCDGAVVDNATYPELYNIIGTLYGAPPKSGNDTAPIQFYLPDYRGSFLRGVNRDATRNFPGVSNTSQPRDPDTDSRLNARYSASGSDGQGNSGNSVGSVQLDAFLTHQHDAQQPISPPQPPPTLCEEIPAEILQFQSSPTTNVLVGPNNSTPTYQVSDNETRALNVYVNFIIKAQSAVLPNPGFNYQCPSKQDCWGPPSGSQTCKGGGS